MRLIFFSLIILLSVFAWVGLPAYARDGGPHSLQDVVGDYYFGDGKGVNCGLTLTEQGTFTFLWHGCLGTYDENMGGASVKEGVLHILPKKTNVQEGFRGTPTDFLPVRWGGRIYLVPTNDIVAFCSEVNQGSEPRRGNWGHYYLRRGDWEKAVTGSPMVPEQWAKYFLRRPVKAKITKLIGKREAWLDIGAEDGILQGMILIAQDHGKLMFSRVEVESVEKNRSRVKCQWKDSRLAVGQTVSSRFHE